MFILDGVEAGISLSIPRRTRSSMLIPPPWSLLARTAKRWSSHMSRIRLPCGVRALSGYRSDQTVDNSERLLLTAAGKRLPIIKTVRPVVISGRPLLLESFVDISARKQAELALSEAEAHFRSLFASIPLPTFPMMRKPSNTLRSTKPPFPIADTPAVNSSRCALRTWRRRSSRHMNPESRRLAPTTVGTDHGQHKLGMEALNVEVDAQVLEFRAKGDFSRCPGLTERDQARTEIVKNGEYGVAHGPNERMVLTRRKACVEACGSSPEMPGAEHRRCLFPGLGRVSGEKRLKLQASAGMSPTVTGGQRPSRHWQVQDRSAGFPRLVSRT